MASAGPYGRPATGAQAMRPDGVFPGGVNVPLSHGLEVEAVVSLATATGRLTPASFRVGDRLVGGDLGAPLATSTSLQGGVARLPAVLSEAWRTEFATRNNPGVIVTQVFKIADACFGSNHRGPYFDVPAAVSRGMAREDALAFATNASVLGGLLPEGEAASVVSQLDAGGMSNARLFGDNYVLAGIHIGDWQWTNDRGDELRCLATVKWWGVQIYVNKALANELVHALNTAATGAALTAVVSGAMGNVPATVVAGVVSAAAWLGATAIEAAEICNGVNINIPWIGPTTVSSP